MNSRDKEQIHALSQRLLARCAHELGGAAALARHLGISEGTLEEWLSGRHVPPVEAIMKALAPLIGDMTAVRAGQQAPDAGASRADPA